MVNLRASTCVIRLSVRFITISSQCAWNIFTSVIWMHIFFRSCSVLFVWRLSQTPKLVYPCGLYRLLRHSFLKLSPAAILSSVVWSKFSAAASSRLAWTWKNRRCTCSKVKFAANVFIFLSLQVTQKQMLLCVPSLRSCVVKIVLGNISDSRVDAKVCCCACMSLVIKSLIVYHVFFMKIWYSIR